MNRMHDDRMGWGVSVGFHVVLVIFLIVMKLDLHPFDLDFTPIEFIPLTEFKETGGNAAARYKGGEQPVVELPTRPMLEESSSLLKLPESRRQAVTAPASTGKPDLGEYASKNIGQRDLLPGVASQKRQRAAVEPIPISEDVLFGSRTEHIGDNLVGEDMFTISWDGAARVKTSGRLPEFPSSVQQDVTIRLSFTVAPNGSVISVVPATKGIFELENAAITALRNWRFSVLEGGIEQKDQTGEITFIFRLE